MFPAQLRPPLRAVEVVVEATSRYNASKRSRETVRGCPVHARICIWALKGETGQLSVRDEPALLTLGTSPFVPAPELLTAFTHATLANVVSVRISFVI
jgi:hypothetical protein